MSIRSMTTYTRRELRNELFQGYIEIKSLNSRFLDLNIKIPKWMNIIEDRIRKLIHQEMKRGKVDFTIFVENYTDINAQISADLNLAKSYIIASKEIAEKLNIPFDLKFADIITCFRDIFSSKRENYEADYLWKIIENPVNETISEAIKIANIEGENLRNDINMRLERIKQSITQIEKKKEELTSLLKSNLKQKIQKNLEEFELTKINEDRLMQEVVYYLDRYDITEELVRAKSHLSQFEKTINSETIEKGKRLDFLLQELFREVTTLSNKINNHEISHLAVDIKVELEKIREQVQNIV